MKRITSIDNAIKYFKENTKIEVRKDSKGNEYTVFMPPVGFRRLKISQNFFDTQGRTAGVITQIFRAFQRKDYANIISE